jgi:parvulin-like peptidyl-prolyl isomerase/glutaredoxin
VVAIKKKKSGSSRSRGSEEQKTDKIPESKKNIIYLALIIISIICAAWLIVNFDIFLDFFSAATGRTVYTEDYVVAEVNGEELRLGELNRRQAYLKMQYGPQATKDFTRNLTIEEMVVVQEARKQGIKPDLERVKEAIIQYMDSRKEEIEQIDAFLDMNNIRKEDWEKDIKEAFLKQDLMNRLINRSVLSEFEYNASSSDVTQEEIEEYFEANKDQFIELRVKRILICFEGAAGCGTSRSKKEALAIINEIHSRLISGTPFEELFDEYNEDSLADQQGSIPPLNPSDLDETIKVQVEKLSHPGQFSEPFEDVDGYQIIMLEEKKDSVEDFEDKIRFELSINKQFNQQIEKQSEMRRAISGYIKELINESDIVYYELSEDMAIDYGSLQGLETEGTFNELRTAEICTEDGKPVIRMFSSTGCPHCTWASDLFDDTMIEYADDVVAYHWNLDTGDNTLTDQVETFAPDSEIAVYRKFNPQGSVPTFVFGCRYFRIGTGFEGAANGKSREMEEYRKIIDSLLEDLNP